MPRNPAVSYDERPGLGPKLRGRVHDVLPCDIEDAASKADCHDDIYNYPSSLQVGNLLQNDSARNLRRTGVGDAISNGQDSNARSVSPEPEVPVRLPRKMSGATTSASSRRAKPMPPEPEVSHGERPELTWKLWDQVPDVVPDCGVSASREFDDDDDDDYEYNYPRPNFSPSAWTAYHQQDDAETYDTPSMLRLRAAGTCKDTSRGDVYDLLPTPHKNETEHYNADDIYDIPPTMSTNDSPASTDHDATSHHSYVNALGFLTAVATDLDDEEHYDVVASSRTRSFRSSDSRYVLADAARQQLFSVILSRSIYLHCVSKKFPPSNSL